MGRLNLNFPKQSLFKKMKFLHFAAKLFVASIAVGLLVLTNSANSSTEHTAKAVAAPRFNFMEGDAEMLRGAKKDDTVWRDPVSANPGDDIAILFYFHNGILNSVATNTTLKVDLPTEFSKELHLKSFLSSDQTAPISETVVNGKIVGKEGLTINLSEAGALEYVPGSTKIYINGAQEGKPMPDGITLKSGLNIGNIKGCWEFAGYVSFIVRIKPGLSDLKIEKRVAKTGSESWQTEVTSMPGDEVAYRIGIRNEGNNDAKDVIVKDTLPSYVTYISGTTFLYSKEKPEGVKLDDTLTSTGIRLNEIKPGYDGITYIVYKAKIDKEVPDKICGLTLINIAKIFLGGAQKGFAEAKIILKCPAVPEKKIEIEKFVRSGSSFVKENEAKVNDILEYKIIVKNTGNVQVDNVIVFDRLPEFVNYIPGSTILDGQPQNDQIITFSGLAIGSLKKGESVEIFLKGMVIGCPPGGDYILINTAIVKAALVPEAISNAKTIVRVKAPTEPAKEDKKEE